MRWSIFALCGVGTVCAISLVACGSKKKSQFGDDSGIEEDAGEDDGGDWVIDPMEGGGEGAGACANCSADLHNVLDCDGNIIKTCPPTEGCGAGGQCVPACDSARVNQSTIGCDYYAVNPGSFSEFAGACYAVYIANTWTSDVTLTVNYGGMNMPIAGFARIPSGSGTITYSPLPNGKLPAGKFAILFLSNGGSTQCPGGITPAVATNTASGMTEIIKGFKISSSAPVQAFDIFPYGGSQAFGSSASLLLPVSAWGTNYLGVHGYTKSNVHGGDHLFLQIVSDENGNAVTISPTSAIVAGNGVAGTGMGQPHTYTLQKGQVLQFQQDGDLSGSPIQSTKPIGLWGGNQCFNVEDTEAWCDSAHQQIPPVNALGHEYVAVKHRDRTMAVEEVPWRILGAVNGTKLTYKPSTPMGAPTMVNARQLVKFTTSQQFVVTSQDDQHPFYMSGHMRGQQYIINQSDSTGDPEYVNVIPPQQYLDNYIFMTDPTMAYTTINLVRDKAKDGTYKDVKLDCQTGAVAGWKTISGTTYQWVTVDLVKNGMPNGNCNNGLHTVKSVGGTFGLTVWGWDQYVSYAYPGGASVKPINTVVVIPTPN